MPHLAVKCRPSFPGTLAKVCLGGWLEMRKTLRLLMILAIGFAIWAAFSNYSGKAQEGANTSGATVASSVVESSQARSPLAWSMLRWPLAAISIAIVLFVSAIQFGILLDYRAGRISMREVQPEERLEAERVSVGSAATAEIVLAHFDTAPLRTIGD